MDEVGMRAAYGEWVRTDETPAEIGFRGYMHSVAQARYIARKVVRIAHEHAKRAGLDPLEHQALVQVFGTSARGALSVNRLAERLDVAPALASRMIKRLEAKGLVAREQSDEDKRVTRVIATDSGVALLKKIDVQVHMHIEYFQKQLEDNDRLSLMAIFAFWAGVEADSQIGDAIRTAVSGRMRSDGRSRRRQGADSTRAAPPRSGS